MPVKDTDTVAKVQFLYIFLRVYGFVQVGCIAVFAVWATLGAGRDYGVGAMTALFFLTILGAVVLSLLISLGIGKVLTATSTGVANIALGIRSWRGLREQLSGDLERVKHLNRQGRWVEAMDIVEDILERDPDFPDALALKARIFWDGFGNSGEAWKVLRKLMGVVPRDDPQYRWAREYYKEVTGNVKPDQD